MLNKQQLNSLTLAINTAISEALSNTHTSTIAKVTKVQDKTISVKPVFKRVIEGVEVELPEFAEVPLLTLQGGSNYRIMPISVGDTALLVFSERCIDDWFIGGATNAKPREARIHDYSDAIAIVGLNILNEAISIPADHEKVNGNIIHTGNNTQTGDYNLTGNVVQTGNQTIEGDVSITGDLTVDGNIVCTGNISAGSFSGLNDGAMTSNVNIETTQDVKAGSISLQNHTHTTNTDGETSSAN